MGIRLGVYEDLPCSTPNCTLYKGHMDDCKIDFYLLNRAIARADVKAVTPRVDDRVHVGFCYNRSEQSFNVGTPSPTKLYCFRPKGHEGDHWGHRNFDDDSNPKCWANATAETTVKAPEVQAKGTDLDSGLLVLGEGVKALQEENKRLKAELEKVQITNSKLGINLSLARSNADEMQRREANAWARVDALRELCGISPLSSIEGINVRAEKAKAERDAARTDAEKWETRANEMGNKFSAAEARVATASANALTEAAEYFHPHSEYSGEAVQRWLRARALSTQDGEPT